MIRTCYYLLFWMNFVADLLWLFHSFYLRCSSVESFVERYIARNDRWFAHLHIQNGGSKRIWILTYSWTGNFFVSMGRTIFRDIKSNYAPVWTISQNITTVPWKLKVPTQFKILKRKRHSKTLRRSEKMHPARILRPESTFLTIPILVAGTNSVSSGNIVDESFFDKYFAENF